MRRSLEDGFYVEAIALQESMTADRLESLTDGGEGLDHGWRELVAYAHVVALRGVRVVQVTDSAVRAAKRRR